MVLEPLLVLVLVVSQHALAGVVEVHQGAESVLLPCSNPYTVEDPLLIWRRSDLNPPTVHRQRDGRDDLTDQNQNFKKRTSMKSNAVGTGDFSLTLTKPGLSDTGNYSCSFSTERGEGHVTTVHLRVKGQDDQKVVEVNEGEESVVLPCGPVSDLKKITSVTWTLSEPESMMVYVHSNASSDQYNEVNRYCGRTEIKEDLLSLNLKYVTNRDSGTYICIVHRDQDILRSKVVLEYIKKEPFPTWATVLLVLLVVLVLIAVSAGLLYCFWNILKSEYEVEVDFGQKSVLLPCRTRPLLPGDARVEWLDDDGYEIHVFENGSDQPDGRHPEYRGHNTEMKRNCLKTGDLSLTAEDIAYGSRIYTCRVYSRKGAILMKKNVILRIKVQQVEVELGVESVLLPCRTTENLPGDVRVEWKNSWDRKVHVFDNGSDSPEKQDQVYRARTRMNEDLLRTGDLSLTLRFPTHRDRGIFTCSVYSSEGDVLMMKEVQLKVKVYQVEVEEGEESVLLPFKTTPDLPGEARVEWKDRDNRKVHVYQNGSDQPEEQNQIYKDRTRMNEDPLRTGDLSLTLGRPTLRDKGYYRCEVWVEGEEREWLRRKTVYLKVKAGTVQVQPEDTRTRTSSVDPTPLLAEQSV